MAINSLPTVKFSQIPKKDLPEAFKKLSDMIRQNKSNQQQGLLRPDTTMYASISASGREITTKTIKSCLADRSKPGGFIRHIFSNLGIKEVSGCGCTTVCFQMNEWGWLGCLRSKNRKFLIEWFSKKAKEQKIEVTPKLILRAIVAAIRENRTMNNDTK